MTSRDRTGGATGLRFLDRTPFAEIHRAFLAAFADYQLDMSYMTEDVLRNRALKNGVDLGCSVGAFAGDELVGLTLVGLGTWDGEPAAFDAGTGIVAAHRGQGLAGRMFDFARPRLEERGVRRFLLEVLQENAAAVRAYEKAGFTITRPFDCWQRAMVPGAPAPAGATVEIRPVERGRLAEFEPELDWRPSWENSFDALRLVPDEVILRGAFEGGECLGIAAFYPTLRWIMTLVVKRAHRRRGAGTALLHDLLVHVPSGIPAVRANNVDPADAATEAVLRRFGFDRFTSQYEMEFRYHE